MPHTHRHYTQYIIPAAAGAAAVALSLIVPASRPKVPLTPRRAHYFSVPLAQGPQTVWRPSFPKAGPRPVPFRIARGKYLDFWPQGPQTVYRPPFQVTKRPVPFRIARGKYFAFWPQGPQTVWRPGSLRAGLRPKLPQPRGRFFQPVPAQVRPIPQVLVPRRPVPFRIARSRYWGPSLAQGAQTTWRPDELHARTRPVAFRIARGRFFFQPVPVVVGPAPPQFYSTKRPAPFRIARSRTWGPSIPQGTQTVWRPTYPPTRRPIPFRVPRGRFNQDWWPQSSQWRPLYLVVRRPVFLRTARGQYFVVLPVVVAANRIVMVV